MSAWARRILVIVVSAALLAELSGVVAPGRAGADTQGTYRQVVLSDAPLGYWRLGEASGSTAADSSGHNHPATYEGGVTLGASGAVLGDTAATFDGSSGHAATSDAAALTLGRQDFSHEAWVRFTSADFATVSTWRPPIWASGDNVRMQGVMTINRSPGSGEVGYETWAWQDETTRTTSGRRLDDGAWHHVVAVYTAADNVLRLYVDGVQVDAKSQGDTYSPDTGRRYGVTVAANSSAIQHFPGTIDEVAVYGSALGPSRVLAHYEAADAGAQVEGVVVARGQLLGSGGSRFARKNVRYRSDPVNTALGSYLHEAGDLSVPSPGPAFSFARTYNSADGNDGPLGRGWTHSYHLSLIIDDATGDVVLRGGDGQQVAFTRQPDGSFTGPPGALATLAAEGSGYEAVTTDQLIHTLDAEGRLVAVTDEQGRESALTYDEVGNLDTVTDPVGRVFTFTHDADGHLVEVGAPDGRSVAFSYTGGLLTSSTDVRGNTTTYEYDGEGRLTRVVDPRGNTEIENTYGADGRVIRQVDPLGHVATFSFEEATNTSVLTDAASSTFTDVYDGNNLASATEANGDGTEVLYDDDINPVSVTDALGGMTEMTWDAEGNLRSRVGPAPSLLTESFTYDADNHLTSFTDPRGNTTTYTYDAAGNLVSETNPDGETTTYAYDGRGLVTAQTDPRGNATAYEYDAVGHLTAEVSPLGNRTTYEYDAAGRQTKMTDPRGGVWRSEYDAAGNVTAEVDPLGNRTEYAYDDAGNRTSTRDPNGRVTTFEYSAADELVAEVDPLGNRTEYAYDAVGNQVGVTNPEGEVTRTEYDGNRNVVAGVTPLGHRTEYAYDAADRRVAMVDPRGKTWAYGYDENDHQTAETDPLGNTSTSSFDGVGNEVSRTDANGHTTRWEYDRADRLTAVVAPDGARTEYAYDAAGNEVRRTDANGHETTRAYDAENHMTARVLPRGERWTYEYDAVGNLVRQVDADGNATLAPDDGVTTFVYDAANRRTRIDYGDPLTYSVPFVPGVLEVPHSEPTLDVDFAYDKAGNRTEMRDGEGTETYAYDAAARLTSITRAGRTLAYGYDRAGRVTRRTYPGGTVVDAAYDDDGRITSVTSGATLVTQAHDATGALSARTFPNGVVETRTYDDAGRLVGIVFEKSGVVVDRFTYALDPVGNPMTVESTRGQESYAYDDLDRLTRACFADCAAHFIEWSYDPVGNRVSEGRPAGTTTYTYDASDRLMRETPALGPPVDYAYDENGNQTARGVERFAYDAADRHAAHVVGPLVHHYRYDGEGKRLSADTRVAGSPPSAKTTYVWDPNHAYPLLAAESEVAGAATLSATEYVHADTELLFSTGDLTGPPAPTTRFATHDRIGNVVGLLDAAGEPSASYAYEPFGVARSTAEDPLAPSNSLRFTGEYLDSRSGLYHLRARDYDPRTGRFTARDPADAAVGSTYAYADDRPTVLADPRGLRASRRRMIEPWLVVGQIPIAPPIPIPIPLPPALDPFRPPFKAPRGTPSDDKDFRGDTGCRARSDNPHRGAHPKSRGRVTATGRTICPAAEMPYLRVKTESWLFEAELFGGRFEQVDHPGTRRVKQDGAWVHVLAVVSTPCPRLWGDYVIETRHTVTRGGKTFTTWTRNSRDEVWCRD